MVARLARELDTLLRGGRVVALRADARSLALECHQRGKRQYLIASFEPERPLAAVTEVPPQSLSSDRRGAAGWASGVAPLLRGAIIDGVHAVAMDRIINLDVASRSAFGVPARHRLVLEMEPRKANGLVVRSTTNGDGLVLAAAKSFSAVRGARSLQIGQPYELPPPRRKELDDEGFRSSVLAADAITEPRTLARLLGLWDPACTPPLARDVVERALASDDSVALPETLLELWREVRARLELAAARMDAPIYAWRRGQEIVACHMVPLSWPAGDAFTVASLNGLCAEQISASRAPTETLEKPLRRKLETMLARCDAEIANLRAARERAAQADALRTQGDAIYANLANIEPGSASFVSDDGLLVPLDPLRSAKQNAADYFRRYKKARSGLPRIEARLAALAANREQWDHLLWELDRTRTEPALREAIVDDVSAAIGAPRRRARGRVKSTARKALEKKPLSPISPREGIALSDGAIAYVGRSPNDNERLTFSVARPNDLWFHARGIPGAHVILRTARAGQAPTAAQIERAAALAAGASRAADANKVEVDYTQRKHVRRRAGRTGLVWYTDFKTVRVAPAKR